MAYFKVILLSLLLIMAPAMAATQKAKITQTVGQVEFQKKGKGKWKKLKVGKLIRHSDKIRTYASSTAELEFKNGSKIIIQENSIINMKELTKNGPIQNTNIEIKAGKILFNIKKLSSAGSTYKFETPTATAAIRGTSGGIGYNGSKTSAYLDEGGLILVDKKSGKSVRIGAKEIAVQLKDGFEVETFTAENVVGKLFEVLLQDTTLFELPADSLSSFLIENIDSLIVEAVDSLVKDTVITYKPIEVSLSGALNSTGGKVGESQASLEGTCLNGSSSEGLRVSSGVFNSEVVDGKWSMNVYWPHEEEGLKTFEILCSLGEENIVLGNLNFEYHLEKLPLKLNLEMQENISVVEGKVIVKGTYEGYKSRLSLMYEGTVVDLTDPSGNFNHSLIITDEYKTATLRYLELVLRSDSEEIKKVVNINPDWSSDKVNTQAPSIKYSTDLIDGKILISVLNNLDDISVVEVYADGMLMSKNTVEGNYSGLNSDLRSGVFDYKIIAQDQAKNKTEYDENNLEFWERVEPRIKVSTSTGGKRLKVPPLPPGSKKVLKDKIQIIVENLPDDEASYLKEIQILNTATNFRRVIKGTELDRIRYEVSVPFKRGRDNKLVVRVVPKNGVSEEIINYIELTR